eukprot:1188796-Karenia_brevis.AAC.1
MMMMMMMMMMMYINKRPIDRTSGRYATLVGLDRVGSCSTAKAATRTMALGAWQSAGMRTGVEPWTPPRAKAHIEI